MTRLINQYRVENGLAEVPVGVSLVQVAHAHVYDLYDNHPDRGTDSRGQPCNAHSWSDKGPWRPVCYTDDHAYKTGMWNKPREITGVYTAPGYEDAYILRGGTATADGAFAAWTDSTLHYNVILEQGPWAGKNWPAMGVGIHQEYAVLWFGDQADPQGTAGEC